MKADMDANGVLVIFPENGVEAYALSHWGEKNLRSLGGIDMIIDCSNFPALLGKVFTDCVGPDDFQGVKRP